MKNSYLIILAIIMASMLFLPLAATALPATQGDTTLTVAPQAQDAVRLKTEAGITEIGIDEYLTGVVAAEMPAEYTEEALKAQAVAARTFLNYKKAQNAKADYDITADHSTDQAFLSEEQLKEKWGDAFSENLKKIKEAVKATENEMIFYEGKPIMAVYHAVSSGKTETAANVWGKDYPYLTVTDSIGDLLCPDYLSTVKVSVEDFKSKMGDDVDLSGDAKGWLGKSESTESGTVSKITLGGKEFKGSELREKFSLKSSSFDLTFDGTSFIFTVRGYGHGVGMSQYGANYMAQQGSDYKEILNWYYDNCEIKKALGSGVGLRD